ncbi:MAG: protein kinase, partial [Planctomycetes bacterium]|nr:protein kinase [Planctomycetota bacterium]
CHYMAMEFVDGDTVRGLLGRTSPLPVAQARDFARQAAKGLGAAHQAGLIHRDVKPDNLMVDRHGVVKVTDFGLVKGVKGTTGLTVSGDLLGTPRYMAPEQGRGEAVDWRADVYALGASLYHMLVGRPPFEASSAVGIIVAHQTEPAPDARAANREVPPGLARLVQRMMAKEPGDRPESMEAVARALEQPDLPGSGRLPTAAGAGTMAALAPRGRVRRLAGRRFLVAHRNPDERRRVMAFLQEEGARVEEAGTGPAVLNRLEGETPVDAVVMALNLPVRDGLATCHAIRAKASSREVPVLLCGTVSGRQVVLAAAKAGAAAFLTEPVDARLLVARLEKCTRVRTVVSQLLIGCFDKPRNAALRAITLRCSFHDVPTPFVALALRPLTQEVVPDHLDVPVYRGALEGYEPVDFPRLEMRVCPDCHYASDRDDHFAGEEGGRRAFFADRRMRSAMRECRDERRLLFEEVGEAFYSEDRDVEDAVRAYRLGVMSERTLFIASGEREGSYLAKAGDYQLRMAQFLEEQGRAGDADDARREAQGTLEAACRAMANGLELDRAQYRRLALAILFGRCDEAVEVRQAMHRRYLDAGSDAGGRVNLLRYLKRAKELLDHRDEYTREAFRVRSAAAGAAGGGA